MAELRIESLYDSVWKIFGFQYDLAVAERDRFRTKMELRLGPETASEIQRHVDAALGRIRADAVPNPQIMAMRKKLMVRLKRLPSTSASGGGN